MVEKVWLLRSFSTWGEYESLYGVFDSEGKAREAGRKHLSDLTENDSSFGWTVEAVPFNSFEAEK